MQKIIVKVDYDMLDKLSAGDEGFKLQLMNKAIGTVEELKEFYPQLLQAQSRRNIKELLHKNKAMLKLIGLGNLQDGLEFGLEILNEHNKERARDYAILMKSYLIEALTQLESY